MARNSKWIQKAIKRPGRIKRYMMHKYGKKAFRKNGEIKDQYIRKEIQRLKKIREKRERFTKRELSLYRALLLAYRLERMHKG